MTRLLNEHQLDEAVRLLKSGELVAFPTETVYGLGADARNDKAVAAIFMAKDRPRFNPLIVHVPDLAAARELVEISGEAAALAKAFWPGPMSLVLQRKTGSGISDLVTAGLETLAIRVPAHPLAQKFLRAVGCPVAAPSANPSGKISPTQADHVIAGLNGRIAAVIDGGPCKVGLESSIFGGEPLQLLRPGGIAVEQAEAVLSRDITTFDPTHTPNAPGQLASHYAPDAVIELDVTTPRDTPHLGFGPVQADLNLSETADLEEAATNLFAMLRQMDELATKSGANRFSVSSIPNEGLGLAIRDRLKRAAAPRP